MSMARLSIQCQYIPVPIWVRIYSVRHLSFWCFFAVAHAALACSDLNAYSQRKRQKPKLRVMGGAVSIYNHIQYIYIVYIYIYLLMIISIWMHTRLPLATLLGIISVSESAPRSEILIGWPGWTFVNRALVGMSPLDRWLGGTSAGCDIAKWTWTHLWMSYGWLIDDVPINHS